MISEAEQAKEHGVMGEEHLWQAVIATAIQAWLHGPLRSKREAEQYLLHDDVDFPIVCRSAGMDAKSLRQRLAKLGQAQRTAKPAFAR